MAVKTEIILQIAKCDIKLLRDNHIARKMPEETEYLVTEYLFADHKTL
jgi:hypothetical protein